MDAKLRGAFVAGRVICESFTRSNYNCEGAFRSRLRFLLTTRLALVVLLALSPGTSAFELQAYVTD